MLKSLKQLKREADARVRGKEIERDEEGRAVIEMTVLKDEDFLSDFSAGSRPVVSADVAQFLEENAKAFSPKEDVCIRIHSDCIDKEEEAVYAAALREYYMRDYIENKRELRRNAVFSVIMAAIGIVALAVVIALSFMERSILFSEALDVFAWVFLWEAVDLFFLERQVIKMRRRRCLRFIDAKIEYSPIRKQK